jgi:hypothetical protein
MNRITRRTFGSMAALAALSACSKSYAGGAGSSSSSSKPESSSSEWKTLRFESSDDQPEGQVAQVLVPPNASALGTIIALHGRGESTRGLDAGAHGWQKDYELGLIHERLMHAPITSQDVKGFLDENRLAKINASLASNPFNGLVVACPYSPNLGKPTADEAQPFARFLTDSLLPKVAELTGAPRGRERTGIDGVSMGGRLALLAGLSHPEVFSSVGAMQPQIEVREAEWLAELAKRANQKHKVALRLVSSAEDPFLDSVQAFSAALDDAGVEHRKIITSGPHDYIWNKGPGGCEMLVFHERVLRQLDPP